MQDKKEDLPTTNFAESLDTIADEFIIKIEDKYLSGEYDLYLNIKFSVEEKRLVVTFFSNPVLIAKFYKQIKALQDTGGIEELINNEKYKGDSKWVSVFTEYSMIEPVEIELFYGIIEKVERILSADNELSDMIDKVLQDSIKNENAERVIAKIHKQAGINKKDELVFNHEGEMGSAKKVNARIDEKIRGLKKIHSPEALVELIDERFVSDFLDKSLGKRMYSFHAKTSKSEQRALLEVLIEKFKSRL